jgi:hypothetical protein
MNRMRRQFRTGKPSLQALSFAASETLRHMRQFRKRKLWAAETPTASSPR